jgi:hypothetical protein
MSGAFSGDEGKETPIGFTVFLPPVPRQAMPRPRRPNVGQVCPTCACCSNEDMGVQGPPTARRESDTARLEEAVTAYRAAPEVFEASGASYYVNGTRKNLARAEALIAQRKG